MVSWFLCHILSESILTSQTFLSILRWLDGGRGDEIPSRLKAEWGCSNDTKGTRAKAYEVDREDGTKCKKGGRRENNVAIKDERGE